MRIAQFTESYRPVINGAAVAVELLIEELCRRHQIELFAPRFPGYEDPDPPGIHFHRLPSYFWPGHEDYPLAVPVSPAVRERFRTVRFDVVHTHSPFALGQIGRFAARRAGIPVVTTYHTLYEEYAHYARVLPQEQTRSFLRNLSRRYCNRCDAIAVPTEPIREVLREYGVNRPIRVIPTGLRLRPPQPENPDFPRGQYGIPAGARLVLYAGRLAREKNLELLFAGFERVARAIPDAWLLLAGSGPNEAEARQLAARTSAPERVVFAGFLAPERMPEVYAAADLFAFASLTDTQGLVLTEAKAAGVPVVSVNAYGPSVVVKHGVDGFLTSVDPDEFGGAMLRILTDPELRERMSRDSVIESRRFSIEATAAAYEKLYADVVKAGPQGWTARLRIAARRSLSWTEKLAPLGGRPSGAPEDPDAGR